ncbi:MAG: 16S rRNA (uracil(1498)-N(3))-methyltransferase [Candidatus Accumulibacter sp.]|jgi:16S rRNA (uracil1498-N3)-methyltransferase|nr:16S rRNA (uracil(1498)-N(3))-methyltransferase [Accumulibacter sp.]
MNPPRFFVSVPLAVGARVELPPGAARHVGRVLRMRAGEALTLFDGRGGEYACRVLSSLRGAVSVEALEWRGTERESPLDLTLAQGLQAGERMDLTVQKAVELGAARIVPLVTRRGVSRPEGERAKKRAAHWRAVAASACEQCGRNRVPEVAEPEDLADWLARPLAGAPLRLMLDPEAARALDALPPPASMAVELLVGAEGGFAPEEAEAARRAGFTALRLGPRILRTETAGLAALATLQCLWGDFGGRGGHFGEGAGNV